MRRRARQDESPSDEQAEQEQWQQERAWSIIHFIVGSRAKQRCQFERRAARRVLY